MDVPPRDGERVSQKRETFLIPSFYTPLLERSFHIISQWPLLLLMEDRLHITQGTHHSSSSVSKLFLCCDSPRRLRLPDCIVPPSLSIVCKNLMKNTPQMLPFHWVSPWQGVQDFFGEEMAKAQIVYELHFVLYYYSLFWTIWLHFSLFQMHLNLWILTTKKEHTGHPRPNLQN